MAFSLGKAERFEAPPKPSAWLQSYNHPDVGAPCIRADLSRIPPFVEAAVQGILSGLDTSHPSFVDFKTRERFIGVDEVKLPGFGGKLSEEQHMLYMIPFAIETPALLALLLTLDKGAGQPHISMHYTVTDVHAFYRDMFEYLQFRASLTDADPGFKARVMEAQTGYTRHCTSSTNEFIKDSASIPGAKALAKKSPAGDAPVPDLSQHYSHDSVAQFARLAFCYNRSLIASIELAICRALDLPPKMCAVAEFVQLEVGRKPLATGVHESVTLSLRAQESRIASECEDYQKSFVAPSPPPQGLANWVTSPEFLFNNWCLVVMRLNR